MKKFIWTLKNRTLLYEILVERFGPFSTWNKTAYPEGKKEEFYELLTAFAKIVGANSADAVQQQIAWATTRQSTTNGHTLCLWQNKVVAYECGFISRKYIPKEALAEYPEQEHKDPAN